MMCSIRVDNVLLQQRKPTECWVASARASPADEEIIVVPLHLACHAVLYSVLVPAMQKKLWTWKKAQRRDTEMIKGLGSLPYEERLKELDYLSFEKRRFKGDAREPICSSISRMATKEMETPFLEGVRWKR